MSRIMLLTSRYTGHGHMSIAQALEEQFSKIDDVELDVVDAFTFMGSGGVTSSKIYNVITRHAPLVWKAAFNTTQNEDFLPDTMGHIIQKRFIDAVIETKPDLILTVHSMFVGSVLNALEREGLNVPVVCLEADIVDIHSSWCDERLKMAICPTEEARDCSLMLGMPEDKLKIIGFPVRKGFCDVARTGKQVDYDPERPVKCLLLGGGGGAGDMEDYTEAILRDSDAMLTVVCGANEKLKEQLEERFSDCEGRLCVRGFVNDIENEYMNADVVICRASPNCMFEAIMTARPMIITGALPGQEKDNPRFAVDHDLGIICEIPDDFAACLDELTRDDGKRFREIRDAQIAYRDPDCARKIVDYVLSLI